MYLYCYGRGNETVSTKIDCLPEHSEKPVRNFIQKNSGSDYFLGIVSILTEAVMDRINVVVHVPDAPTTFEARRSYITPDKETEITGQIWFVNGHRFDESRGVAGTKRKVIAKLKHHDNILELTGSTHLGIGKQSEVEILAVNSHSGKLSHYKGMVIDYIYGWDGLDDNVSVVKVLLKTPVDGTE